jgi:DNA polymerase-1
MGALRSRVHDRWGHLGDGAPHLVFFLHDEVVLQAPREAAAEVAEIVTEAAAEAGRLLFGSAPVRFPLTVAVVDDYSQAK